MMQPRFSPGDQVVFRRLKWGSRPGRRARDVEPAPRGECYSYRVDKYWVVAETDGETVTLMTRRGKRHVVHYNNPNLRPASLWERIRFASRFPRWEAQATAH
jgi:hypothetical protein